MGAIKVTTTNGIYYQLLGPAGRWLSSGPSAYAFDERENFVGWSVDSGDVHAPAVVYVPGAIRERISVEALRSAMQTNIMFPN